MRGGWGKQRRRRGLPAWQEGGEGTRGSLAIKLGSGWQDRGTRAGQISRAAELGQTGVGMSIEPVSVWSGDHAGEARSGRAGRGVHALAGLRSGARKAPRGDRTSGG